MIQRLFSKTSNSDNSHLRKSNLKQANLIKCTRRGKKIRGHKQSIQSVCFSSDGLRIASASWDRTMCIWDVSSKKLDSIEHFIEYTTSVVFSPTGKYLAVGSGDSVIRLFGQETHFDYKKMLMGHTGFVNSISFSHDT